MSARRDAAIADGACDHAVGICWGKPLPDDDEARAIQAMLHEQCAHALGICKCK